MMRFLLTVVRPPLLWDALAVCGLKLFAVGLWWIHPPTALITTGILMMTCGLFGASVWHNERERRRKN